MKGQGGCLRGTEAEGYDNLRTEWSTPQYPIVGTAFICIFAYIISAFKMMRDIVVFFQHFTSKSVKKLPSWNKPELYRNTMYCLLSGNYFGSYFYMGGERFEMSQPEAYLFGENSDLNFLGNKPMQVCQ